MSIESITTRIREEAGAYADEMIADAKVQAESLLGETRIEADKLMEEAKAAAERDSRLLIERRKSVAGLEARKMQLGAKQEIISESFDRALEKFRTLDEAEYYGFLSGLLSEFNEGEIRLNEGDLERFGRRLESEFAGRLTVAKEPAAIKGGFLLKQGDVSINASAEKLIEDQKGKLTGEIAALLFPQK